MSLPHLAFSIAILLVAVYLVIRRIDVRIVLFGAGLALASIAGSPWLVFDAFLRMMGEEKIIGPICSAMGFAFVLKYTGCDRELVKLLLRPIQHIRWLLVPGGCIVGFITNSAITSQTAAAAAVGPILLPVMMAAGWPAMVAAATVVIGCSAGGNLFNPGEPDIVTIHTAANVPLQTVLDAVLIPELLGFSIAVAVYIVFSHRLRGAKASVTQAEIGKINIMKAVLPPLPALMLLVLQPQFNLIPPMFELYPKGLPVSHVMIFCTMLVLLVERKNISKIGNEFFEGLGYGFAKVISLILTATCLISGMEAVGLVQAFVTLTADAGFTAKFVSAIATCGLGVLSGSGTAPSVAFSQAILPHIASNNPSGAVDLGVLGAIGATFGRTMSPAAAVIAFTSVLSDVPVFTIVRQTAIPLLAGLAAAIIFMALK
ncbi:C4-dicarboxylate transporter DcuC [Ignavibacteria bacterium]|nr:C4-dicarboxylate transporter DcuC [Bacteroidota bacterium]MCZ2132617.1 C4-dicarboxylate transporter DcuC [Bacteroidota bacterium]